ncbi:multidrug transporter [Chitinophaga parva]|uniref:Multidrug transporter n=1 Tax=Chitinophaga parva TaxID=2169414 RepID=A0A2T7BGI2_9BACT|nr:DUF6055 domain-containing protein [Chitinophaga parva]PUZ25384.1 multidrug transporter [Chitinophaga parva]
MKKILLSCILLLTGMAAQAAKTVFIPTEFSTDPYLSTWSYARSYQSANFVVFWGNVVGTNPATYADPNLAFNPQAICDTLEKIYTRYIADIKFCSDAPTKNLGKYKIIIIMNDTWGTGGPSGWAFGGAYDNTIGAMWVHPNATRDGGVISHELTHSLQGMISIQENTTGGGFNTDATGFFWECHANYMRTQMYPRFASDDLPRWLGTSAFHWSSTRHHYDTFKLLFLIQQQDSIGMINNLWKLSTAGEHPLETYRRLKGWNQSQLNDFVYTYAAHEVTEDYTVNNVGAIIRAERDRLKAQEPHYLWRQYTLLSRIDSATGHYAVPDYSAPQDYGYNVIPLYPTCSSKTVTIKFRGHTEVNSYAGWRYGFVTEKADGTISRYSPTYSASTGEVSFTMNSTESRIYFVVAGAPTTHTSYPWEPGYPKVRRFPYEVRIANALPEGFQSTYRSEYRVNGHAHSNGGGWVANTATVAATAYVGPKALVLGTSNISGTARIDGNAWVENATVQNTVVIKDNANVWGGTYSGSETIAENAILNLCTITGNGNYKGNCMEWGVTFGNNLTVGGDAEIVSCSTVGTYLQVPHPNNGRTDCDGKGASDASNTDINSSYSNFTASQMAWITTPTCTTSLFAEDVVTEKAVEGLQVYPNPASGTFTIALKGLDENAPGGITIRIYDMSGKGIYRQPWKGGASKSFSISNLKLKPGIYLINGSDNKHAYTQKLVVTQ